jgi:hypothetical protein
MHGALQHRVWSFGVHEIENAMDHLVAPDAENGRSQDALIAGIDQDFMNPWVSPVSTARLTFVVGRSCPSATSVERARRSCWERGAPTKG